MKRSQTNIKLVIDGCLNANSLSQEKLFKLKYGYVKAICYRYANTSDEAKEMLNDSFYTLFKNLSKYDNKFPFEPWLRKLTINTCLKYKRKYSKEWRTDELTESHESLQTTNIVLPSTDELNYLHLLKNLPDACKTIINLYIIEEYKHHEIAELLDISVGTSKSNLHRAKQLLLKMLEKDSKGNLKLKSNYGG